MKEKRMRVRHRLLGGHVHMRVFVGDSKPGLTLGRAGVLILTSEEFDAWREGRMILEFQEDDAP